MTARVQSVTTIALVGVAAALGAYLFFVERANPTTTETEARKHSLLPFFRAEEISEIALDVRGEGGRLVRTAAQDGGEPLFKLSLGQPAVEEDTEPAAVDRLIHTLDLARPVRKVDPVPDGAKADLDHPRATVVVKMGGSSQRVRIGTEAGTPAGSVYAEVEGQGVFVVSRDFASDVLKPLDTYRARTIIPYSQTDIASIRWEGIGGSRKLTRAVWGGFRIDDSTGNGARVGRVVLDQIFQAMVSIRADRFITKAAAETTLDASKERIVLRVEPIDKTRPALRIELGGDCPASAPLESVDAGSAPVEAAKQIVALRREPQPLSACVPASVLDTLRLPQEALADRRLLDLRADEIEELKIQRGDRILELLRKGTGWKLRRPEDRDVSAVDAKGLVEGLARMEGEIIKPADLGALGLIPPGGTLTVIQPASGAQKHPEQKVEIGNDKGETAAVRREQDGVVLRLTRDQARLLEPVATYIRSATLLDIAPEQIRRVAVSFGSDKQVVARTPAGFRLEVPPGFDADGSLSADLFERLAKLTADRWVADNDDGSFGLAQPRISLQLDTSEDGGAHSRKLLMGNRLPDGSYAQWESGGGVFVLSRDTEATLTSYVIDRSAFMVDPSEVKAVRIASRGKVLQITVAPGDLWTVDADAGIGLAETSLAKIQEVLTEMRTEGVVHLGDPRADEGFDHPLLELTVHRVPGRGEHSGDIRASIGRGDLWRTRNVYYARRQGYSATYAIAAAKVKPLLNAMGTE